MTRWVMRLIAANCVLFLLTLSSPAIVDKLMLVPAYILSRPWTIVSYMFLHAGFAHIFFNMLGLFFFGPQLELELGGRDFLWLYFISGMMGGVISFFFTPYTPIIGASGAVYGVMLGFAYFWPRARIFIWGIIPIEARWLVVIMTAFSLYGGFGGTGDGIAHFAHLGGFLGGYLFLKWHDRARRDSFQQQVAPSQPTAADMNRWMSIPRDKLHEVNRAELDRILDKLKTTNGKGLTSTEIDFLNRFSDR